MPKPPLDGTILVTGASSGIGAELARQLAPRAGRLVLVARRRERLEALREELQAVRPGLEVCVAPCDLQDRASLDAMLAQVAREVGPVDVLINNAGLGDASVFDLARWSKLETLLRVNIEALTYLCHRLVPGMVERGRGGVLNISSGFGLTFFPGMGVYVATKQFVTGFTECLRLDLRGTGVAVTQVCPGPVHTEFEAVSGAPDGVKVPSLVEISARTCARQSLRGFRRGCALVVPGFVMRLAIGLGRITPRWMLRLVYAPGGPMLRRRQLAEAESAPAS